MFTCGSFRVQCCTYLYAMSSQGLGFRVAPPYASCQVFPGLRVQGSGLRAQGSGFSAQGSGFRVQGSGFRVQGPGLRVQGSGFRAPGLVCFRAYLPVRQVFPGRAVVPRPVCGVSPQAREGGAAEDEGARARHVGQGRVRRCSLAHLGGPGGRAGGVSNAQVGGGMEKQVCENLPLHTGTHARAHTHTHTHTSPSPPSSLPKHPVLPLFPSTPLGNASPACQHALPGHTIRSHHQVTLSGHTIRSHFQVTLSGHTIRSHHQVTLTGHIIRSHHQVTS